MNRADVIKGVLMWEQVSRTALERAGELRQMLAADARAELEEQGTAARWVVPEVATVSLPISREAVAVQDPTALAGWVARRYPAEVVPAVRPAFGKVLLARLSHDGETVSDPETGEVVPGLTVRAGGVPGALRIVPAKGAEQVAGQLAGRAVADLAKELGL